jgi:hypothetical protein
MKFTHGHFRNLQTLSEEIDLLIDNEEYVEHLQLENPEDYLVAYSYIHDIIPLSKYLIKYGIEFQHLNCPLSDESFLLINYKQK